MNQRNDSKKKKYSVSLQSKIAQLEILPHAIQTIKLSNKIK
jgi:hypothetical protein